jgi:hypothetical protein
MGASAPRGDSPETRTFSSLIFAISGGEDVLLFLAIEIRDRNQGARVGSRARGCNDWTTKMAVCDGYRPRRITKEQRGGEAGSGL